MAPSDPPLDPPLPLTLYHLLEVSQRQWWRCHSLVQCHTLYTFCLLNSMYCDSNCLQWKSSYICAHSMAVSDVNGDLSSFLKWYIATNQQPHITSLAMHALPASQGCKGGVLMKKHMKSTLPEVTVQTSSWNCWCFDKWTFNPWWNAIFWPSSYCQQCPINSLPYWHMLFVSFVDTNTECHYPSTNASASASQ